MSGNVEVTGIGWPRFVGQALGVGVSSETASPPARRRAARRSRCLISRAGARRPCCFRRRRRRRRGRIVRGRPSFFSVVFRLDRRALSGRRCECVPAATRRERSVFSTP